MKKQTRSHQDMIATHLDSAIPLSLPLTSLNPLPHDSHNLASTPSIDKNNKPQSRELRLVSLIQPRQLCHHLLAALQLCLLSCTLCRIYFRSTEAWMRSEDGEE